MGDAIFTRRFSVESIPFYELSINPAVVDATLTNFPVMVRATSTNYNMSLFGSNNVYFTDENTDLLDFEIEYGSSTERIYHVRIPSVSSSVATKFRIYFNGSGYSNGRNSLQVWDANYLAVWHFVTLNNSSNTNNNLVVGGGDPDLVSTSLGYGRDFVHTNADWYQVTGGTSYSLLTDTNYTVSFISTITARNDHQRFYSQGRTSGTRTATYLGPQPNSAAINGPMGTTSEILSPSELRMFQFSGTSTGSTTVYYNGNFSQNLSATILTNGSTSWSNSGTRIGRQFDPYTEYWDGVMQELRISNTIRSAAWLKAEYHTLYNTMINNIELK
jgi:hypothetical protein